MQSKPGFGRLYVGVFWMYEENTTDTSIVENFLDTLVRFNLAPCYYQDYGCNDRIEFLMLIKKFAEMAKFFKKFPKPTAQQIKEFRENELYEKSLLVRNSRLSITPITHITVTVTINGVDSS